MFESDNAPSRTPTLFQTERPGLMIIAPVMFWFFIGRIYDKPVNLLHVSSSGGTRGSIMVIRDRNIITNCIPNLFNIYSEIFVNQAVSHTGYVLPWYIRMSILGFLRNFASRLANYLQHSHDCVLM